MHPRQLRVGDLVDDYCPRERRLSNHAVVALVGDDIRQVRCTTCDAEHDYKGAKVPVSRRKKPVAGPPALASSHEAPSLAVSGDDAAAPAGPEEVVAPGQAQPAEAEEPEASSPHAEISLHRRLIRATLPRIESDAPARPIPEFTMHRAAQPGHRHGKPFRQGAGGSPHRHVARGGFGQGRQGQGEANGNTFGPPRGQRGSQSGPGGVHGPRGAHGVHRGGPGGPGGPGGQGGPGNPQGPRHPRHGFGGKPPRGPKKH